MFLRPRALAARLSLLVLTVPGTALSGPAPARLQMPAQQLDIDLRAFARATGSQVAFDAVLVRGKTSRRLSVPASLPPEAALKVLLQGTGLAFVRRSSGVFIITPKPRMAMRPPRPAPPPAPKSGREPPSEIVVTARKREERMIDIPVSISAVGGLNLERRGARTVADFLQETPGVGLYDRGNGLLKVTIRGVSTTLGANENGYYLDDMPFTGVIVPLSPDVRAWDLERVEVLRGPQGTLFGEGSMGGTVRILTKDADPEEWEAKGSAYLSDTSDGGTNMGLKGALNAPIVPGILAVRVAGTAEHLPGWVDSDATGRSNLNDQTFTTYRIKARFEPTDRLSINGSYWFYKGAFPGGDSTATDSGQQSRATVLASTVQYRLHGVSARYGLDGMEAFYGFSHSRFGFSQQGPASGGVLYSLIGIAVDAHEARLASSGKGPLKWTAGGYLRNARRDDVFKFPLLDIDNTGRVRSSARALFGEATYTLPAVPVDVTAGLRYYRERLRGFETNAGVVTVRPDGIYTSWNPRFSIAWHPARDATLYVSAAKGFRAGQLQPTSVRALAQQLPFKLPDALAQDSIWSYELGGKAELFDRRLALEGAVYHSDWKDVAVRIPIGTTGYNALVNSDGTQVTGVELSAALSPIDGLVLTAGAAYTDATYASSVPGTGIVAGDEVEDVARFTASASADYRKELTDRVTGFGRLGWQHSSKRRFSAFPEYTPGDRIDRLDARIGVEIGRYSLALFVDNATNENGAESFRTVQPIAPSGLDVVANRLRPRTLGVEISVLSR